MPLALVLFPKSNSAELAVRVAIIDRDTLRPSTIGLKVFVHARETDLLLARL